MKRKRSGRATQMAVPAPPNEQESVSIRKIANGYVISRSGMRRGKYFTHEEYSAGRPVVTAAISKAAAKGVKPERHAPRQPAEREVGFLRS